jgi:non-ribosomal peptide synthetase component F
MAKKQTTVATDLKDIPDESAPNKTPSLPAMTGPGVATLQIPGVDKFVRKYESAKSKRCAESPLELAAKNELKYALQQARESLPLNSDGQRFYRSDEYEKDYLLDEKLAFKKHHTEDEED